VEKLVKVLSSEFLYSVPKLSLMRNFGDEIAFLGRSNTGTSSLINAIAKKKDLARTSKTPGRTRHAVVYRIVYDFKDQEKAVTLVDLPGFGFASMSKAEAQDCERLIFSYLKNRSFLKIIVLLLDIRRSLDEREKQIIAIAKERNISLILVLTKADKLSVSQRKPSAYKIAEEIDLGKENIIMHSINDEASTVQLQKFLLERF
jgi:GTP-binding protein